MSLDDAMNEWESDARVTDRDQLPDLASGRLDDVTASRLRRMVASDAELADEFAIIDAVRASAPAPVLDLSRIVAALPRPATGAPVIDLAARRAERARMARWQWRVAATMLVMVAGAAGVLWSSDGPRTLADVPVATVAAADLGEGLIASVASLDELSDDDLQEMLSRLDRFDGTSSVDPSDLTDEEIR